MPTPTRVQSYPPAMLTALEHARTHGIFRITSLTPAALRLKFYGLRKALEKADRDCFGDLNFIVKDDTLIIQSADSSDLSRDLEAALKAQGATAPSAVVANDAEDILKRLGF